jgi:outer membrane protein OmpA-like peptidoglycan-associated protein
MKLLVASLLAGAAMLTVASAEAASPLLPGWYVQGAGGGNLPRDTNLDFGNGAGNDVEYDTGWIGALSIGYGWPSGLRLEFEGNYRSNDIDSVGVGTAPQGDSRLAGMMVNAIYGFSTLGWVQPFVGLGIGGANLKYDGVTPVGPGAGTRIDDSSWGFATQGIVGAEFPITQNLGANLQYRYTWSPGHEFNAVSGSSAELDYSSHAVLVGLRWSFGAPKPVMAAAAPPPPPAPAPPPPAPRAEPPRPFIVFFEWDRSDLTAEARNVIASAAQAARQNQVTRIELTGHADRSGGDAYNMRLSQRRADAVKAELTRLGVPANQIATFARGESEPLVQTADGVREPQNRRVHIVFPAPGRPGA